MIVRSRVFWYISALLICLAAGASAVSNWGPVDKYGALLQPYKGPVPFNIVARGTFDSSMDKAKPENWVKCIPTQQLVDVNTHNLTYNSEWRWAGQLSAQGDYIIYPLSTYLKNQWSWLLPKYRNVYSIIEKLVQHQVNYTQKVSQWTKTYFVIFAPIYNPIVQEGMGKYLTDISDVGMAITVPAGAIPGMPTSPKMYSSELLLAWSQEPVDSLTGVNLNDKYYFAILEVEDHDIDLIITHAFYSGKIYAEWKYSGKVNKLTIGK